MPYDEVGIYAASAFGRGGGPLLSRFLCIAKFAKTTGKRQLSNYTKVHLEHARPPKHAWIAATAGLAPLHAINFWPSGQLSRLAHEAGRTLIGGDPADMDENAKQ